MKQSIRITSRVNKRLYADAIPGHFATNHSHINYYIDMSEIKHSMAMSREAARSIAYQFSSTSIDTLLCMEGTEYIGAYLAGELSSVGMGNVNSGKDIYLVEPDSNVNGQFVFSDNLRHMIEHRNVLVLVNSASTGQTFSQAKECVEYYGGRVSGMLLPVRCSRRTEPSVCRSRPAPSSEPALPGLRFLRDVRRARFARGGGSGPDYGRMNPSRSSSSAKSRAVLTTARCE